MFSYTGDPADSAKDAVRYLIQDTSEDGYLASDEEIAFALTQESGIYNAAALACETIGARFARQGGSWVRGRVEVRTDAISTQYLALAKRLRQQAQGSGVLNVDAAYAGGISVEDKANVEADTDRVVPRFTRGQFDPP